MQPNYTCHCWFSDERERVLLGTDTGEILLLEGGEVKATLCHGGGPDAPAVECIVAHSKGFVAGWSNGCVSLWEKSGEDTFRRSRDLQARASSCSRRRAEITDCSAAAASAESRRPPVSCI